MSAALRQTSGLISAERAVSRPLPPVHGLVARQGATYERKVSAALSACAKRMGARFEPSPWFSFEDEDGWGQIVPDGLFTFATYALVIEVKRTFVREAITKLAGLYVPVVRRAERVLTVRSLVICHALTSSVTATVDTLSAALSDEWRTEIPTLLWLGRGRIEW